MRVRISLAGRTLDWRYRDSDRFAEWILGRPWLARNEVRSVRFVQSAAYSSVFAAIHEAMLGADRGTTDLRETRLDPSRVTQNGFAKALAAKLGLSSDNDHYALHQSLARHLANQTRICLIAPLPAHVPTASDQAEQSVDLIRKIIADARLIVVFADTLREPLSGESFDFSRGEPLVPLSFQESRQRIWDRYLHVRLSWEAAGDPTRSADIANGFSGHLAPEDDVAVERVFNEYADRETARVSPELRTRILTLRSVSEDARGRASISSKSAQDDLLARGLAWRPNDGELIAPAPWLARGLLRTANVQAQIEFLRGCLRCVPLHRELLTECLLWESVERGHLLRDLSSRSPGDETRRMLEDFQQGRGLTYKLHPQGCPAAPNHAWAFASLGEVLMNFAGTGTRREARFRLLYLRNHLAHGHYVGWEAVSELLQLRFELGNQ